jgi:dienelactone hydrolase
MGILWVLLAAAFVTAGAGQPLPGGGTDLAAQPERGRAERKSNGNGRMTVTLPERDTRLTRVRTLEAGIGFQPPASRSVWLRRAKEVREQILVAAGLWPMPPKLDLQPRVYGRLERDGYTVEKVVLRTLPGFYLTGNLYRPKGASARAPGVLCPHGHWSHGRFEDVVQARGAGLARLGCVAFHYDMIGFGDSKPLGHTLRDARMERLGMSMAGLQLWNSLRALDFLRSLPDVDPARIGCTGASGGGTQTFLLAAVEDRVRVSAPVCMVSAGYQGGCECENAPSLRVDTDNVEIAAAAAPRPQILVGATGDWTKEIVEKGFPEIQATYRLLGHGELIDAVRFDAGHNYNQQSREVVYGWFARHLLQRSDAPGIREAPFTPEPEATLSCYDGAHPRPADEADAAGLKTTLARMVIEQAEELAPRSADQWRKTRRVLEVGLRHRLAVRVPPRSQVVSETLTGEQVAFGRRGAGDRIPGLLQAPLGPDRHEATLVVLPDGMAGLAAGEGAEMVRHLRQQGHRVLVVDLLGVGEHGPPPSPGEGFFTTYNRTLLAERVQDVLTALAFLRSRRGVRAVHLAGVGAMGPVCLLARAMDPGVARAIIDADAFEYALERDEPADRRLPGILRLGGLRAAAALAAPGELLLHHTGGALDSGWARKAYELGGRPRALQTHEKRLTSEAVARWLCEGESSHG